MIVVESMMGTGAEFLRAKRSLFRSPGFTLASVLTMGMGLGATGAIFTVVDAVLLRPLPYPEAERVVRIQHVFEGQDGTTPLARLTFSFFERENSSLEVAGGYWSPVQYTLTGGESAQRIDGVRATAGLLRVLGARPVVGRLFTEEDAILGGASGVVISHRLWEQRYGGDPTVVGSTVLVEGVPREVLGVMAPQVDLPRRRIDLWLPYAVPPTVRADDAFRIHMLARVRAGLSRSAAEADLAVLTERLPEYGAFYVTYLNEYGLRTSVSSVREEVVGEVERPLWILLGAVTIVLLVAAANVATLFLVRAEGRREEIAIRTALGAGRVRLFGHFLAESIWVAGVSGVIGLLLARVGVQLFASMAPPALPRSDAFYVGGSTAAVLVALSLVVAVALGVYPFLRFGRGAAGAPSARLVGRERRRAALGSGFVIAQVALALVLLSGSALLVQTFRHLRAVDPGFDPQGVLVAQLSIPGPSYPSTTEVRLFQDRLREGLNALPGVRRAALGPSPLAQGEAGCSGMYVEGVVLAEGEFPPCVPIVFVSPGYWDVLGIRWEAGRVFNAADLLGPPVAVVTNNAARRLWPDGEPLRGAVHPAPRTGPPWFSVVGVTAPVRGQGPDQPSTETLYLPLMSGSNEGWGSRTVDIVMATVPRGELELVPGLRRVVSEIDPNVPVTVVGRLEDQFARTMLRSTFTLFLLGTAAATALGLGLVGLYGVVAHQVASRRTEIAVRIAVGAEAAEVRNLVLGHSLRLVLVGIAVGLVSAALLTRTLSSLLFDVRPGDPILLGLAALTLVGAATVASWIPAHRATRIDPAMTLKSD